MTDGTGQNIKPAPTGVIFATTGKDYNILARRAARTLRLCMPKVTIDWFTDDTSQKDPVFDAVHKLSDSFFRPKMEALRRSRFDRTLFLDADTLVLLDISEIFSALSYFDLLAAHAEKGMVGEAPNGEPPRCLLPLNSGVLAIKKSEAMDDFLLKWESDVRDNSEKRDQPALRRNLMRSALRFSVLGAEYNMMKHSNLENWGRRLGAPRIIHSPQLHKTAPGDPDQPYRLEEALSSDLSRYVRRLVNAHKSPDKSSGAVILTPRQKLRRQMKKMDLKIQNLKYENDRLAIENECLRSEVESRLGNKAARAISAVSRRLRNSFH